MTTQQTEPRTKLSYVRELMDESRWQEAVRLAARFPSLGQHRAAILDAHTAYTNPRFVVQLGRDVEQTKERGHLALIARFGK